MRSRLERRTRYTDGRLVQLLYLCSHYCSRTSNDNCYTILCLAQKGPRPGDSWAICDSGLGLIEEAVKFAAGRIEGTLILFRAVVDQWPAVGPNHITNKLLGKDLS